jgi:pyridoxamine 5'-phosphate oxidase
MANPDPIALFRDSFTRAKVSEPFDHTAASLATADQAGRPSARMVLVKEFDANGFLFYTNYESRKAADLRANPRAALCFYWPSLGEQFRIEGSVAVAAPEESDRYFASRLRGSQLGAWASKQSQQLSGRTELIARYLQQKGRFFGRTIPRPDFWGGYRLVPETIELWKTRLFRLHDRYLYTREADGSWSLKMLYP